MRKQRNLVHEYNTNNSFSPVTVYRFNFHELHVRITYIHYSKEQSGVEFYDTDRRGCMELREKGRLYDYVSDIGSGNPVAQLKRHLRYVNRPKEVRFVWAIPHKDSNEVTFCKHMSFSQYDSPAYKLARRRELEEWADENNWCAPVEIASQTLEANNGTFQFTSKQKHKIKLKRGTFVKRRVQ